MFEAEKSKMIKDQLIGRGIKDARVLKAMSSTPREEFVREMDKPISYADTPLSIGCGQTISQPYIVAYMLEMLDIRDEHRVLEIGTGSGYEAALLSRLAKEIVTIEIVEDLYEEGKRRLENLGYKNIEVVRGDGYRGYEKKAPYDRIILSAAPTDIPENLVDQLAINGRLIAPVGGLFQELILLEKDESGKITKKRLLPVKFVPMVGE
ncbi:protein-L-isoaspartate(D-aspartate) O-methyltransferase [uncultured Ilyobacter sp.]|uniref:protein-L-isoaspartate(D-aspartate) O-methyltransferase n=1 Tax=uncultured Ilyobacter sp. TaxID=544433 RepID=UPI0029F45C2B|nr:protein-L-isoaspartate(D-aspartate) O-methyltransferase [uncultured Ilyobacter sp.]